MILKLNIILTNILVNMAFYGSLIKKYIQIWAYDAIRCSMDLRQQYWQKQSRGQYCCQSSIKPILPRIINQKLLIICQMFMFQAHYTMHTSIARFFLIFYYHFLFYSLGHGATIMMLYYTIVAPMWLFVKQ